MKRWFSLALVALFLMPVLAIVASASEIYQFEPYFIPAMYSGMFDFFPFGESDGDEESFFCSEPLSEGVYCITFMVNNVPTVFDSVPLSFELFDGDGDGIFEGLYAFAHLLDEDIFGSGYDTVLCVFEGEGTMLATGAVLGADSVVFERVGDLPSQGGFDSLLGDVSSFAGSCISFITKVADTITGSPFLLLTVGFLFLGGSIGITGRLFSRR